jgi:hypothetical protein
VPLYWFSFVLVSSSVRYCSGTLIDASMRVVHMITVTLRVMERLIGMIQYFVEVVAFNFGYSYCSRLPLQP